MACITLAASTRGHASCHVVIHYIIDVYITKSCITSHDYTQVTWSYSIMQKFIVSFNYLIEYTSHVTSVIEIDQLNFAKICKLANLVQKT